MGNHKVLKTAGINLRYSMYDFIDAVKKHHIIWDREHENFHNRELRDQAWQQIGQQLCKNFEAASGAEKQEIAKTLLKRWKNTRDSYLRVNRLRQTGEEVCRASYIYEKELSFLLDVKTEDEEAPKEEQKKRKQFRILRTPNKRRRASDNPGTTQDNEATLAVDGLHSVLDTLNYTTDASTPAAKSETSSSYALELNCANSSAAHPAAAAAADPDPDQAFFDSIKPHMQRMSSDQKLDFQIEVLKILRHFKPN
ncbi:transcription factor Adf-1 [Drosophila novamexicana]|uniref:transcription factor Adf-1 n=1 Tax=Drosophila novamexicana TaxID=47314 RepID=UPI0011E5C032|nr:transcription factor Adf-1 [Drosophila novamexicana]